MSRVTLLYYLSISNISFAFPLHGLVLSSKSFVSGDISSFSLFKSKHNNDEKLPIPNQSSMDLDSIIEECMVLYLRTSILREIEGGEDNEISNDILSMRQSQITELVRETVFLDAFTNNDKNTKDKKKDNISQQLDDAILSFDIATKESSSELSKKLLEENVVRLAQEYYDNQKEEESKAVSSKNIVGPTISHPSIYLPLSNSEDLNIRFEQLQTLIHIPQRDKDPTLSDDLTQVQERETKTSTLLNDESPKNFVNNHAFFIEQNDEPRKINETQKTSQHDDVNKEKSTSSNVENVTDDVIFNLDQKNSNTSKNMGISTSDAVAAVLTAASLGAALVTKLPLVAAGAAFAPVISNSLDMMGKQQYLNGRKSKKDPDNSELENAAGKTDNE